MKRKLNLVILAGTLLLLGATLVIYLQMNKSQEVSEVDIDEVVVAYEYSENDHETPTGSDYPGLDENLIQQDALDSFSEFFEENRKMNSSNITGSLLFLPIIGVTVVFFVTIWQLISVNRLLYKKRMKNQKSSV